MKQLEDFNQNKFSGPLYIVTLNFLRLLLAFEKERLKKLPCMPLNIWKVSKDL